MKKPSWNPREIWDSLKRLVTRNLWLKVISLLLAAATYSALKDRTTDHQSDSTTEAEMYDSILRRLSHTLQPEEKPQTVKPKAEKPQTVKPPEPKKPVQPQNDK